ncbi:hypothetical protein Syun_018531 [Stephania yunnanensis]|uniref:Uncharacterized protein n=1 Tax=Stephania yunnanensis TaxID=152371 RepID=A0AAP0ISF8_9MAGN
MVGYHILPIYPSHISQTHTRITHLSLLNCTMSTATTLSLLTSQSSHHTLSPHPCVSNLAITLSLLNCTMSTATAVATTEPFTLSTTCVG